MMVHLYSGDLSGWKEMLLVSTGVMFWIVIIGGVMAVFRGVHPNGRGAPRSIEEELLFERFARGEIDDDEYRRRRESLRRLPTLAKKPLATTSHKE